MAVHSVCLPPWGRGTAVWRWMRSSSPMGKGDRRMAVDEVVVPPWGRGTAVWRWMRSLFLT